MTKGYHEFNMFYILLISSVFKLKTCERYINTVYAIQFI